MTLDGVDGDKVAGDEGYRLRIVNLASDASTNGLCVNQNNLSATNITVLHVECSGATQAGLNNTGGGMFLRSPNTEAGWNWIHSTTPATGPCPSTCWWANGIVSFAATGTTNFDDNIIHDNWIQDITFDAIACSSQCSIYNNRVINTWVSGPHSDSLLIQSGSYSQIYNNVVLDSGGQDIYIDNLYDSTCAHIRIYNNVIDSDPGFGIVLDPEGGAGAGTANSQCTTGSVSILDDVVIANNTFVSTSGSNMRVGARGAGEIITNLVILNNIWGENSAVNTVSVTLQSDTTLLDDNAWDYNSYGTLSPKFPDIAATASGVFHTLAELRALSPARETNGKTGDVTYASPGGNDFHLAQADTVARGAGRNLTAEYPFLLADADGNPRPGSGAWDLGAYAAPASDAGPITIMITEFAWTVLGLAVALAAYRIWIARKTGVLR